MSELQTRPTFADLYWNSLQTYARTKPPAGKRQAGYDPGTGNDDGEVPAGDHFNWLLFEIMQALNYFALTAPRVFEDIWEALAAAAPDAITAPNRFVVAPGNSGKIWPFAQIAFNTPTTSALGGPVGQVCTDGRRIFHIGGNLGQTIVAVEPEDGSNIWETNVTTSVAGIATDGQYVYYTRLGQPGLRRLAVADGAAAGQGGTETGTWMLAVNGVKGAGIRPTGTNNRVVFWTLATPAEDGTINTGEGQLDAMCIDKDYVYCAGQRLTTPYKVFAYDLQTRGLFWRTDIGPGSGVDPTVNGMCLFGPWVFLAHNRYDRTGGGDWASVTVVGRMTGSELAHWDLGQNAREIATDGERLYVTRNDYAVSVYDPSTMVLIGASTPPLDNIIGASRVAQCCDGLSLIGSDGANNVRRDWLGQPSRSFQVCDPTDDARPPWAYTLAIPAK